MKPTPHVLAWTVAGLIAVLLPVATLIGVYLLIAELTARTESAGHSLDLFGYFGFAMIAVVICGLIGTAGRMLLRFKCAVQAGIALGWLLLSAVVLLLLGFAFVPPEPPWEGWRSFGTFIALLGTPIIFAAAMTTYTLGFALRGPRRRWALMLVLSLLPGLMIALYGLTDPRT